MIAALQIKYLMRVKSEARGMSQRLTSTELTGVLTCASERFAATWIVLHGTVVLLVEHQAE